MVQHPLMIVVYVVAITLHVPIVVVSQMVMVTRVMVTVVHVIKESKRVPVIVMVIF